MKDLDGKVISVGDRVAIHRSTGNPSFFIGSVTKIGEHMVSTDHGPVRPKFLIVLKPAELTILKWNEDGSQCRTCHNWGRYGCLLENSKRLLCADMNTSTDYYANKTQLAELIRLWGGER